MSIGFSVIFEKPPFNKTYQLKYPLFNCINEFIFKSYYLQSSITKGKQLYQNSV